ncbi:MAG TPA: hypothetical protein VGK10_14930 [Prolixibacteraceae bacterium]|jgi:hypothetical protein
MKKILYLVLFISLIQGCKKENSQDNVAGKFALNRSINLKSANIINSSDSTNFVLDSIKSSRSFYFILSNVGQNDITDISISSDNASFIITPSTIQTLPGINSKNNTSLSQAISLDIVHGTRINGIGYTGILNMGDNYCTINIKGQTNDGQSNTTVNLTTKVKIYAKLMAISLYQGDTHFELTNPSTRGMAASPFETGELNFFYYYNNIPFVVKNTGNVSIDLSLANWPYTNTIAQNARLKPNDTLTLKLNIDQGGVIRLNSDGTIFDQQIQKLSLGADGNAYLTLMKR